MSILIDELLELRTQNQEINGKWYIAKPILAIEARSYIIIIIGTYIKDIKTRCKALYN